MQHDRSVEVQHAFVEHLSAFAASLPAEEQILLTQLVALAAVALDAPGEEIEGYLAVPYNAAFFTSLITEVGLPVLDASSKDAAKMSVKFSPG